MSYVSDNVLINNGTMATMYYVYFKTNKEFGDNQMLP